jgi:hypothetical protein
MSPEQALSATSKNYTLCDMFSFGLIVKWLIVGRENELPFQELSTDQIILEHRYLHQRSNDGDACHPYVSDLRKVPPLFHALIRGCASVSHVKRWAAADALFELKSIESKVFASATVALPAVAADDFEEELKGLVSEMIDVQVGLKKNCVTFARFLAGEGLMSLGELRPMSAAEARELLEKSGMKKLQIDKVLAAYNRPSTPLTTSSSPAPATAKVR